jgi:hypothetical protein
MHFPARRRPSTKGEIAWRVAARFERTESQRATGAVQVVFQRPGRRSTCPGTRHVEPPPRATGQPSLVDRRPTFFRSPPRDRPAQISKPVSVPPKCKRRSGQGLCKRRPGQEFPATRPAFDRRSVPSGWAPEKSCAGDAKPGWVAPTCMPTGRSSETTTPGEQLGAPGTSPPGIDQPLASPRSQVT